MDFLLAHFDTSLAVLTSALAGSAWIYARYSGWGRKRRLEGYLRKKRKTSIYQHTANHLKAVLGMSEDQILEASNKSKRIRRLIKSDTSGMAKHVLFEYIDD